MLTDAPLTPNYHLNWEIEESNATEFDRIEGVNALQLPR